MPAVIPPGCDAGGEGGGGGGGEKEEEEAGERVDGSGGMRVCVG